ncbi:hypothetical protein [Mesorhizobium sp. B2-1-3A]|uniref:hypothetical protein n=1 Tax=Mesorhizobium sp. B2-1-3A TaxID=2589971 RepID=UPI0011269498|nr:hypothetical protein [Mesorhizobium sp. B2-1-3A]TPM95044.1 hypothetical protein FJ977_23680 [Mesorhizobium sp. B2-1-3A]
MTSSDKNAQAPKAASAPKPATPSPATEKVSGAGPALSEHSKDAKAPKGGRQPGAYVKDRS